MLTQFKNIANTPPSHSQTISPGGLHMILELLNCDTAILNCQEQLFQILKEAAHLVGCKVISQVFHQFNPQGVTGLLLLSESHISIHTWPERSYASLDFYSCGNKNPMLTKDFLVNALKATEHKFIMVNRGINLDLDAMTYDSAEGVKNT